MTGTTKSSKKSAAPKTKDVKKVAKKAQTKTARKVKSQFPPLYTITIENVKPIVNGGDFPIKREPMDWVNVTADLFRCGHERFEINLLYRKKGDSNWLTSPMKLVDNDEWAGSFQVTELGLYEYTIEGITTEIEDPYPSKLEKIYEVRVDPHYARNSSWYEIFPRSQGKVPGKSGTWNDVVDRIEDIKYMGFDTLYVTPIHPIGFTKRKGPNNALVARTEDPGCPYAIGNLEEGGHYSLEPQLGTEAEFDRFVKVYKENGFNLALDVALNCSPDHPHVHDHPEWFYHEADGSIQCAINPPKRYEDVYPYNYVNENYEELWEDVRDMLIHWTEKGFDIFRIDNPHTKPFAFWEWIIKEVKAKHPHVVFLAEAFTRPKLMHRLAKIGFDQSYSYFTWREEKREFEEYLKELTQSDAKEYMRVIFFPTTPDILPKHLQNAPREAFELRAFLAMTLSSLSGIYSGYELCENVPSPVKDELLDSEKYEFSVRNWWAPGNIKEFISKVNWAKKVNSALWEYDNLVFHSAGNDQIMAYSKRDETNGNTILCIANLDSYNVQESMVHLDMQALGLENGASFECLDILNNEQYIWHGNDNYVKLDPKQQPAHFLQVRPL
ncbi:MAG: DUF3416 domain-containing protein [Fibrobacterales bacterium]